MDRREMILGSLATVTFSGCGRSSSGSEIVQKVEANLPLDVYRTAGNEVIGALDFLTEVHKENGTAFVLGPSSELNKLENSVLAEGEVNPEATLAAANKIVFPKNFRAELASLATDRPIGDWPDRAIEQPVEPILKSTINWMTGNPHEEIFVGVVPTRYQYQIPAYMSFGGWNECPLPKWHVAAIQYWEERWGARLMALTSDTMELRVKRRPSTKAEAIELAREHCDYCSDIVDQGVGSIATLAEMLMSSDDWFFWWD